MRATELRRAAKTRPIPIPAPPRPMAALPIPSYPGISHCHYHHHHPSRTEREGETCVLGDLDEGVGHLGGVGALGLGTDGGDLGAGSLKHGGCALHGVEGSGVAGGSCLGVREGSRQRNEAIGKLHWELSVLAMGGVRRAYQSRRG